MNGNPLVSSVMAFLNAEKFIEEAIESVFAQTYDNWELLLVDDGSTDDSTQIALRYAERHPEKVRYLEHPGHQNRGKETSRNVGMNRAKGKYISFLDSDDVWLPHTLEQQVAILNSHPEAGMVYGSSLYWFGWTGNPEDSQRDFRDFVEECGVTPNTLIEPLELLRVFLRQDKGPCVYGSVPPPCSVLVRHEVARNVGGFDEEFSGLYEDRAFYVKVGTEAPVFVAGECWCKYRQHPDSSVYISVETNQSLSARVFFLNWIGRYLFERGVQDAEVWKLLQEKQLGAHNRQVKKLERALREDRRKHNRQVKKLERALEEERRQVRQLVLQIQDMNGQEQNGLTYKARKLLQKVIGQLRAKMSSR
jgi:glycosyltransferase involved in cell wall biosynthesis